MKSLPKKEDSTIRASNGKSTLRKCGDTSGDLSNERNREIPAFFRSIIKN